MLNTTIPKLRCPRCDSKLELSSRANPRSGAHAQVEEITSGHLKCVKCRLRFPVLAGVVILVEDVREYIVNHVKGIAQVVQENEIPSEYLEDFCQAKAELQVEHIEEDLEAQRVTALYLMNHYLQVKGAKTPDEKWWQPRGAPGSPLIDQLVREHWDKGPFSQIQKWVKDLKPGRNAVDLACGLGGLYPVLRPYLSSYLGVDSSFASIALARHLALGTEYRGPIGIPEDLLEGPVSRRWECSPPGELDGRADFVVGDLDKPPLEFGSFDLSIALNAIDMLDDPATLPKLQHQLLGDKGVAIQSCPYIWHEFVARKLREKLKANGKRGLDSARAVEWLYERRGFSIQSRVEHLPWLFLKHARQLEIYSVHLFTARKG